MCGVIPQRYATHSNAELAAPFATPTYERLLRNGVPRVKVASSQHDLLLVRLLRHGLRAVPRMLISPSARAAHRVGSGCGQGAYRFCSNSFLSTPGFGTSVPFSPLTLTPLSWDARLHLIVCAFLCARLFLQARSGRASHLFSGSFNRTGLTLMAWVLPYNTGTTQTIMAQTSATNGAFGSAPLRARALRTLCVCLASLPVFSSSRPVFSASRRTRCSDASCCVFEWHLLQPTTGTSSGRSTPLVS